MAENISDITPAEPPGQLAQMAAIRHIVAQMAHTQQDGVAPRQGDEPNQIVAELSDIAGELDARRGAALETERRLQEVMELLVAMAGLDFSKHVSVGEDDSILNAVATATNLLNDELRASVVSRAYVDNIIESMIDPLIVVELDATIRTANRAALDLSGYRKSELIGRSIDVLFADEAFVTWTISPVVKYGSLSNAEKSYRAKDGRAIPVSFSASLMLDTAGEAQGIVCVARDITERKQAEEALRQSMFQEEIIRSQSALLAELSTPLIPISDRVVVMPLIGTMDSRRVQHVLESLLSGIATSGADVAILDITGVAMVDTQVANGLIRAAQAVKLLGARVMLTGIRPEVAQTLVGLGVDLSSIATHSSLQSGIAAVMGQHW
ncbi:MAG: PAS domain S-box protein [Kouleothrix sp.]|nr:PAS domain S-box protein [Kouleothrix sp.]